MLQRLLAKLFIWEVFFEFHLKQAPLPVLVRTVSVTCHHSLSLLLAYAIEAHNGDLIELGKFLLDKLLDILVDLLLHAPGGLQPLIGQLNITVDELIQLITVVLDGLQVLAIDALLLRQTSFVAHHELWPLVERPNVTLQVLTDVKDVLEFV